MATVETILSRVIPQQLMPGVAMTEQQMDPFLGDIRRTSKGVTRLGVGTDGWKWERAVGLGLGGVARFVSSSGPAIKAAISPLIMYDEQQTYPRATDAVTPGYDKMVGNLAQLRGNIVLDEALLRENEHQAIITDVYRDTMRGVSLRLFLMRAASWHTTNAKTRHICTVSSWAVGGSPSGSTGSFIPAEGNEVLFHEGMLVDIFLYDPAGNSGSGAATFRYTSAGTYDDTKQVMVVGVDPMTRTVYLADVNAANTLAVSSNVVANGDIVVHAGQLSIASAGGIPSAHGPFGYVDFLVNSGSILGVSTSQFLRLRSIINSNFSGPWTEDAADLYFMWYNRWHQDRITRFYMTPGVELAHKRTLAGMFRADRTGKPKKIVGGFFTAAVHVHNGQEVEYISTPYLRSGAGIGVVMENNFEELMPPNVPQSGSYGGIENGVEFKNRNGVYDSIFSIVGKSSSGGGAIQASTLREAPFCLWTQVWPMRRLPGVLVTGISEANLVLT